MSENASKVAVTLQSQIIVDGLEFQAALKAAKAIVPSNPGEEFAVVALDTEVDGTRLHVSARNPDIGIVFTAEVQADDVDIVAPRHEHIELGIAAVNKLLAFKVKPPKEDEPLPMLALPMLALHVEDSRVKQSDADVLFGESLTVYRVDDLSQHVLTPQHEALAGLHDGVPAADSVAQLRPDQLTKIGRAFGHLGEYPRIVALEPEGEQTSSVFMTSPTAMAHVTIVETREYEEVPDSFDDGDFDSTGGDDDEEDDDDEGVPFSSSAARAAEQAVTITAEDRPGLRIVKASPSGGIA